MSIAATLLVAACGGVSHSGPRTRRASGNVQLGADNCLTRTRPPLCYTPQAIRAAYGVAPLLAHGVDGRGETVVLPEFTASAPATTDIYQDVSLFDRQFGLPAARVTVVSRFVPGAAPALANAEEWEDAEVVHAIAPGAAIEVVLQPRSTSPVAEFNSALRAVSFAVSGSSDVISVSLAVGEQCLTPAEVKVEHSVMRLARRRHVTVVAASGDTGAASTQCETGASRTAIRGISLPAADPLVTAAGGTRLLANPATGAYLSETVWNSGGVRGSDPRASGGGFSRLFTRPFYQAGIMGVGPARGDPDVAGDADLATGPVLLGSFDGHDYLTPTGGTSAATPLWGAIAALADQYAHRRLGFLNVALYRIARSSRYHEAFHDITAGTNSVTLPSGQHVPGYQAVSGWDAVTGLGTPNAQVLVPLLAKYVRTQDGQGL